MGLIVYSPRWMDASKVIGHDRMNRLSRDNDAPDVQKLTRGRSPRASDPKETGRPQRPSPWPPTDWLAKAFRELSRAAN